MTSFPLPFEVSPYRLSGAVFGALLNDATQWEALGPAVHEAPYKAPPKAPVLHVMPRNTLAGDGADVTVPRGVAALEVGATLGIVIGRTACRLTREAALGHVAGYTIVNDVSVPVASHYRPAARFKARDGFCPIGPCVVPAGQVADPDALAVRVYVDAACVWAGSTGARMRGVAQLLVDVSEFMTLHPGDVLTLGTQGSAPRAHAGQSVAIVVDGLGRLTNRFVACTP
jgi:5-oxopent-3-ene-1,2,5-tricarboxylate decarboxylase/2-hydroxyhepta-2,4-diene-1,7-dioate isomerase